MAFWRLMPDGLLLNVRVTPKADADRIERPELRDDGSEVLRVRVRAVPDGGKANAAVIQLIASTFGIPRTAIDITAGATARFKTLALIGAPADLAARARQLSK